MNLNIWLLCVFFFGFVLPFVFQTYDLFAFVIGKVFPSHKIGDIREKVIYSTSDKRTFTA
jgi:hypothetical protein